MKEARKGNYGQMKGIVDKASMVQSEVIGMIAPKMSIDSIVIAYQELEDMIAQGIELDEYDKELWVYCFNSLRNLGIRV